MEKPESKPGVKEEDDRSTFELFLNLFSEKKPTTRLMVFDGTFVSKYLKQKGENFICQMKVNQLFFYKDGSDWRKR